MPSSAVTAGKFALPFSVVIHPLNDKVKDEVPVVNFGATGVIRCRRCRTYVNPFVSFIDAGRRWRCNVCSLLNDVPSDYYCNLDSNGKRRDINERPELSCGSVEYVAPADYMVEPPCTTRKTPGWCGCGCG
jgi:protein transport protein SEC24